MPELMSSRDDRSPTFRLRNVGCFRGVCSLKASSAFRLQNAILMVCKGGWQAVHRLPSDRAQGFEAPGASNPLRGSPDGDPIRTPGR